MKEQLELSNSGTPHLQKDLLIALKCNDFNKFQDILQKNDDIDIDYWFGDPEHGTLLDVSCMTSGHHMFVRSLLNYGANPNIVNRLRKNAPLHSAVQNNDLETIKSLLNYDKTDINILDSRGNTPLHLLAKLTDTDILEVFLKNTNVNVNIVNKKGKSPLLLALEEKNKGCVHLLLNSGNIELNSDPNFTKIKELLNDIIPEWKSIYKSKNKPSAKISKTNAFFLLHSGNYSEFLSILKERKDDTNFLEGNNGSHTFLQYCCEFGLTDLVNELLSLNVNPNTTTSTLIRTPLMIAAYKGFVDIVKMLINTGKCFYDPVNTETVLHCAVKGAAESPSLGDSDAKKDHLMCLSHLLTETRCKIYINSGDDIGNTPLHYAAKQGDNSMILLLLKEGASLNCFNTLHEPAFAVINFKTLQEYLNSCIYTNEKLPREETYEIILNYMCLKPVCHHNSFVDGTSGGEMTYIEDTVCKQCNNFESKALLYLAKHNDLKNLLKHPIFTSFLYLKWQKIKKGFYINLLFYLIFWASLTCYILFYYTSHKLNFKGNMMWWILMFLLMILILRELTQLFIAPIKYLLSLENWLEVAIVSVTFIILFFYDNTPFQYRVHLSAIGVMLSWSELVLLIGRHPALSTKLEMLKTVSWNFLIFLAWYSILIIAFAISFYILFGMHECSNINKELCTNSSEIEDSEDFFRNPGVSFFKTVIMLTGEFDASSIPFDERPGTSHILFVAFVFLIAIVLFNLLNGLAVSDTQAIKSDAELVGYISRVKLVSYIETLVLDPLPAKYKVFNCNIFLCQESNFISYYKNKIISRYVNLFQNEFLSDSCEIRILPNLGNHVEINHLKVASNRKESEFNFNCYKTCNLIKMDSEIVHSIKQILFERLAEKEIKQIEKEKSEKEQLLIESIRECKESLLLLTQIASENKDIIGKIVESMNISN